MELKAKPFSETSGSADWRSALGVSVAYHTHDWLKLCLLSRIAELLNKMMGISYVTLSFPEHFLVRPLSCHTPIYSILTQQQFAI